MFKKLNDYKTYCIYEHIILVLSICIVILFYLVELYHCDMRLERLRDHFTTNTEHVKYVAKESIEIQI